MQTTSLKVAISVLFVLAAFATVAAFIFGIWDRLRAPSDELEAEVAFAAFQIPPGLDREFRRLYSLTEEEWLTEQLDLEHLLPEEGRERIERVLERAVSQLAHSLRREIPNRIPYDYSTLVGFYKITVANNGDRAVSTVKLVIPEDIDQVLLTREGTDPQYLTTTGVVQLGKLQPREMATLVAWSNIEPSLYSASSIELTHDAGVGEVSIRAPVGGLGLWIDRYGALLVPALPLLLGLLLLIIIVELWLASKGKSSGDSLEVHAEEEGTASHE